MGETVRTLVAEYLDGHTHYIYEFFLPPTYDWRREWTSPVTREVTSILRALRRLEQFG